MICFCAYAVCRADAVFLGVTTQPERLRELASRKGIPEKDALIVSVPFNEVARYLAAADCGFLLRDASVVNQVAAPVKFGEYLASGTPPIMSAGIGDYSAMASRERLGLVLPLGSREGNDTANLSDFLDAYQADPVSWRTRCRRAACDTLNFDAHRSTLAGIYERLSGNLIN